ncbi:hypothetical protein DT075_04600 [Bacillus licheniformis]|nr:hypothetical protein DT075_04600 [Bacillus licheniformis]
MALQYLEGNSKMKEQLEDAADSEASQLKRNLHLTVQLLEFGHPLTIGLNMIDVAGQRGVFIDHQKMSDALGVPVIPVIARSGKGCDELRLTGSYEYVGNWSGVTVEKKVGLLRHKQGMIVDLPGVYTLSPLSRDEGVVTDFLLNDSFSDILNIVDRNERR